VRKETIGFKIFSNEHYMAAFVAAMVAVKAVVIGVGFGLFRGNEDYLFMMPVQISDVPVNSMQWLYHMSRFVVGLFAWQLVLAYCLWLQKKINPRYSMRNELTVILLLNQLISFCYLLLIISSFVDGNGKCSLCVNFAPIVEMAKITSLVIAMVVTTVLPLFQKKAYHMLLPIGQNFAFTAAKTI
jgi:hypothetical protein